VTISKEITYSSIPIKVLSHKQTFYANLYWIHKGNWVNDFEDLVEKKYDDFKTHEDELSKELAESSNVDAQLLKDNY
jgi:hypothetical protein